MARSPVERLQAWRLAHPQAGLRELVAAAGKSAQVPPAYLYSLVRGESGWNPRAQTGSYRGLLQVGPAVREDYNRAWQPEVAPDDLWDPATNVAIGVWMIARIHNALKKAGFVRGWSVRDRWVTTWAWNAGWSRAAGVQKALALWAAQQETKTPLERIPLVRLWRWALGAGRGSASEVSPDRVYEDLKLNKPGRAEQLGLSRHLANAKKLAWAKAVAYRSVQASGQPVDPRPQSSQAAGTAGLALLLVAALLLAR